MKNFKKIGLMIYYILTWFLFILSLVVIFAGVIAILNGDMGHWFIFIIIVILPFFLGYLLRQHFKVLLKLIIKFLLFMKNIKLTLPVTILLSCIILGGFFYVSQISKQRSIEKQQQRDIDAKKELQEEENKSKELAQTKLDNCLSDAKERYSNLWNEECEALGKLSNECKNLLKMKASEYIENNKKVEGLEEFTRLYDEFIEKKKDCSCRLPSYSADSINGYLKDFEEECYKKNPLK